MPAILDDPSAGTIYRVSGAAPYPDPVHPSFPPTIVPRHVTLRDRQTVATVVPFASRHQVPNSLLHYLHDQFNKEIEGGDTYPMMDAMPFDKFADYWFQNFAGVMLLGQIERGEDIVDNKNWSTECLGTFYIKPNYPGRSSHICNAGFIVTDASRNRGVGRLMGETYLDWAPKLGYTYSVFNLVYETNVASCKIWDGLGFKRIGRVKGAGNLKSYPDRLVDAIIFGRDLGDAAGNEELVSEERFDKIKFYLKYGRYPNGADRAEKSRLRSAATHYKLIDGDILMLKDKEVISDPRRQYDIAREVHNQSHAGINRTTATIAERYHWSRIKETVSDVIRNCSECKELGKSSMSSTASQAQQNQHQHQPSLSNIMTTTSSGIKRPNLSPPIGASSSKRSSPAPSPSFVTAGDTVTIGDHSRTHPIPALPPEPPSHIDPYGASSHHYNQSHPHFTDASGQQISILTSPSPAPMQVTPDTTSNLATVQHNPFRHAAHESPMLPHHPSPPPQHHHSHYPPPYCSHPHHEPQHYSVATPSHHHQPHHPHVSLPPIIDPQMISQPGPSSTRTTTAHHHPLGDHGQLHNERDYAQHHQPQHQTQPNPFHHRHPLHPPTQMHPLVYSQQQQHQIHPSQLHTPTAAHSHQLSSHSTQHHPVAFEAPRVQPMMSHNHIMQHDRHQQQQYQPQYQHAPHQQHHQVYQHQHPHQQQQHPNNQQHHSGASSASEPDTDSDTFQALLTVAGTEAVGIGMGMADGVASGSGSGNSGLDRLHDGGRGGHYDQIHDRVEERPEAVSEQRSGGSSGEGEQGERRSVLQGGGGGSSETVENGDHRMDQEGMADEQAATEDNDMDDKDLDMLIDSSSEDEDGDGEEEDEGRDEYHQKASATKSTSYGEKGSEQQPGTTSNSNSTGSDTDMREAHPGSSFTCINDDRGRHAVNTDGQQHNQQSQKEPGSVSNDEDASAVADANDTQDPADTHGVPSAQGDIQHTGGEVSAPESEHDDNDVEMGLDEDAVPEQVQGQDRDEYQRQDQHLAQDWSQGQGRPNLNLADDDDGMDMTQEEEEQLSGYGHGNIHDRGQDNGADAADADPAVVDSSSTAGGTAGSTAVSAGSSDPGSGPTNPDSADALDPDAIDTTGSTETGNGTTPAPAGIGTGTASALATGGTTPTGAAAVPGPNDNSVGAGDENLNGNGNGNGTKEKEKESGRGVGGRGSSAAAATGNGGDGSSGRSVNGGSGSGSGSGKMDVSHLLSSVDPKSDANQER